MSVGSRLIWQDRGGLADVGHRIRKWSNDLMLAKVSNVAGKNGKTIGSLRYLCTGGQDEAEKAFKAADCFREEFPIVAELLGGIPATATEPAISAGAITFYIRGGRLQWSANCKSQEKTFYGEVADSLNPWASINTGVLLGEVSTKTYTPQKTGLTEEQKALIL